MSESSSESSSARTLTKDMRIQRSRSLGTVYSEVHLWAETKLSCPVWSLSVSRSGILCGCDDGRVVVLNTNLAEIVSFVAHAASPVVTVLWAGDSLHFLSVGTDSTVKVWTLDDTERGGCSDEKASCIYSLTQNAHVVAASFHPFSFPSSSLLGIGASSSSKPTQPSHTLFVLTNDRRIGVWTDGLFERYESLSSKDPPVCMSVSVKGFHTSSFSADSSSTSVFIAVGTQSGDLLLYSYIPEKGIYYETSISCKNRRGVYKDGTPVVSVVWVNRHDMLVATQDNRIRLVRIDNKDGTSARIEMKVVQKYRGHKSSSGEAPLAAFVLTPPFADPILQCGSECGRIYVWPMDSGGRRRSILKRFARTFKPSKALKATESWYAVDAPDKLTAAVPAPWAPEKGSIGGNCTVASSLEGYVRLFFNTPKNNTI
jgi:hypothetical protein